MEGCGQETGFEVFVASKDTRESCKAEWERHSESWGDGADTEEDARARMENLVRHHRSKIGCAYVHAEIIDISTEETIHEETWQRHEDGTYSLLPSQEDARNDAGDDSAQSSSVPYTCRLYAKACETDE